MPKPHTVNAPGAPGPTASAPGPRPFTMNLSSDNRSVFRRFWDWLLGRKPPQPQQAPAPTQPVPASMAAAPGLPAARAVASPQAVPTPAPTVPVVLPIALGRPGASPAPGARPQPSAQERERERQGLPGAQVAGATAGGAVGAGLSAAALEESFRNPQNRQQAGDRSAAARQGQDGRNAVPGGYIVHLTNGRRFVVPHYEEQGDHVMIDQINGRFGLPKSIVARIEPRSLGAPVMSPGVNVVQ